MNAEHRAYLEAIVSADDPSIRPADRIRAIELLRQDEPEREGPAAWVAEMDETEVDRQLDSFTSLLLGTIAQSEEMQKRYPLTAALLKRSPLDQAHFERLERELLECGGAVASESVRAKPQEPTAERERAPERVKATEPTEEPGREDDGAKSPEEGPRGPSWADDAWKLERGFSGMENKQPGTVGSFDQLGVNASCSALPCAVPCRKQGLGEKKECFRGSQPFSRQHCFGWCC